MKFNQPKKQLQMNMYKVDKVDKLSKIFFKY